MVIDVDFAGHRIARFRIFTRMSRAERNIEALESCLKAHDVKIRELEDEIERMKKNEARKPKSADGLQDEDGAKTESAAIFSEWLNGKKGVNTLV